MSRQVTAGPRNPLRTYQFRVGVVKIGAASGDVAYVAGVRSVSGLRAQVAAYETWEGGNNLHRYANPNRVTWEPITLEQGLALDATFERWSQAVLEFTGTGTVNRDEPVKRQVIIDVWDENAHPAGPLGPPAPPPAFEPRPTPSALPKELPRFRRYHVLNAWVSKYQAVPKLDSMTSEVALLSVELMHEGWIKDPLSDQAART